MRVLGGGAVILRSRLPTHPPPDRNARAAVTSLFSPPAASESHKMANCARVAIVWLRPCKVQRRTQLQRPSMLLLRDLDCPEI